jgi:hypothetical protein
LGDLEDFLLQSLDFIKGVKVLKTRNEDLEIETDMDTWNTLDLGDESVFAPLTEVNSMEPRTPKFI